jgi:hypothetical protein
MASWEVPGRRMPVVGQIAGSIRSTIVAGDLSLGDRVVESRLARQIGAGQPAVRESLMERKANLACVVTVLTCAEIEGTAIELAMQGASQARYRTVLRFGRAVSANSGAALGKFCTAQIVRRRLS